MDLNVLQDTFVKNLEIERTKLGLTQREMADTLGLPISTYKRIIYREVELRGVVLVMKLYYLTGKLCGEYLELRDEYLDIAQKLHDLTPMELEAIDNLIEFIKKHRTK